MLKIKPMYPHAKTIIVKDIDLTPVFSAAALIA